MPCARFVDGFVRGGHPVSKRDRRRALRFALECRKAHLVAYELVFEPREFENRNGPGWYDGRAVEPALYGPLMAVQRSAKLAHGQAVRIMKEFCM